MNTLWYSFHETVHGYRHIQEGEPCQDDSSSYSDPGQEFQIAVVADGHGDPACSRSSTGSGFAVSVAMNCMQMFAKAILDGSMNFGDGRQQLECVRQLTNTIVAKWYTAIQSHIENNTVTEEELQSAGDYEDRYRKGDRMEHLYGTTLIAALRVKQYLILLQQGDGRCDVFYADGQVDQPIPWDERCVGNYTTSMCDVDAAERFRAIVIHLDSHPIVGCYLGSDGVEDSYYDNEKTQQGTHRFYMDLTCKLCEYGTEKFPLYLKEILPAFSRNGSADDVSVAGIVDIEGIKSHIDAYANAVEIYDYQETLQKNMVQIENKIVSMERKRGLLKIRWQDKKKEVDALTLLVEKEEKRLNTTRKESMEANGRKRLQNVWKKKFTGKKQKDRVEHLKNELKRSVKECREIHAEYERYEQQHKELVAKIDALKNQ